MTDADRLSEVGSSALKLEEAVGHLSLQRYHSAAEMLVPRHCCGTLVELVFIAGQFHHFTASVSPDHCQRDCKTRPSTSHFC